MPRSKDTDSRKFYTVERDVLFGVLLHMQTARLGGARLRKDRRSLGDGPGRKLRCENEDVDPVNGGVPFGCLQKTDQKVEWP